MDRPLLVFDGDCAFCTRSVRFVERRSAATPTFVRGNLSTSNSLDSHRPPVRKRSSGWEPMVNGHRAMSRSLVPSCTAAKVGRSSAHHRSARVRAVAVSCTAGSRPTVIACLVERPVQSSRIGGHNDSMNPRSEWKKASTSPVFATERFQTMSGIPSSRCTAPRTDSIRGSSRTPWPYASMYRSKLWTMRMFAGFGTAIDHPTSASRTSSEPVVTDCRRLRHADPS